MKTKLTLWALALACASILAGCREIKNGPELTEPAEIYDTCFTPAGHGQTSGGYGMTMKGKLAYHFPQSISIPAVYAVVFKCQHGKFVIDGERGKALYERFSKGDQVTVKYCDKIEVDDGVERAIGLHFIDAVPRK